MHRFLCSYIKYPSCTEKNSMQWRAIYSHFLKYLPIAYLPIYLLHQICQQEDRLCWFYVQFSKLILSVPSRQFKNIFFSFHEVEQWWQQQRATLSLSQVRNYVNLFMVHFIYCLINGLKTCMTLLYFSRRLQVVKWSTLNWMNFRYGRRKKRIINLKLLNYASCRIFFLSLSCQYCVQSMKQEIKEITHVQ